MKRYKILEITATLSKIGGVGFGVLMLLMLTIATQEEMFLIAVLGVASLIGGLFVGQYIELQIDNTKYNQLTSEALVMLLARKKKKEDSQGAPVINDRGYVRFNEGEKQNAPLKRMKV